ncbi:hypothetical protein AX16_002317 [Volvariella volvacea WC 439]|nr:hypothetical protein AX16_002317 [Volvariella volvacea WC 439]
MSTKTTQRLQAIQKHTTSTAPDRGDLVLVLPTGARVTSFSSTNADGINTTHIALGGIIISSYRILDTPPVALDISSVGTKFEGATDHLPRYKVLEVMPPQAPHTSASEATSTISIPNIWTTIYALFTLYSEQEHIPIILHASLANENEIREYLLTTALGRLPTSRVKQAPYAQNLIYLSRGAFWQAAGTQGYHHLGWLRWHMPNIPMVPAFTRTELVIAAHPLRPVKPQPGQVLYKRWCPTVASMLEFIYFDLEGVTDGVRPKRGEDGILMSKHLTAFHEWHNDERVNEAWGEKGGLEAHKEYVEAALKDPAVLPCMMAWDGELMGYTEFVWIKENHVAQHFPVGVVPGDWDRGLHVLVGENKFLGGGRSECWLRGIAHYLFLSDSRTQLVIGEPKEANIPINKVAFASSFHMQTVFDFPYKRSTLLINTRERFFKSNRLHI